MYIVTSEEMRAIDRKTINNMGIPALLLMENAGRGIAEEVLGLIREQSRHGGNTDERGRERWLVLAGKGNNGGDGLAAARHLLEAGVETEAALVCPADQLTGDAGKQADMAVPFGVPCFDVSADPGAVDWHRYTGVIDALLGTGSSGAPREPYATLIRGACASGLPIVAADIPSGLDADTGAIHDPCIRADRTVALAFLKRGLVQYPGAEVAGKVIVRPICIPERLAAEHGVSIRLVTEDTLRDVLGVDSTRARQADSHKGTYGHVLLAAGSPPRMAGAGILAAKAALRAGCGLVTWALPGGAAASVTGLVPEAMLAMLPEESGLGSGWGSTQSKDLLELAEARDVCAAGPGLGRWSGDGEWLRSLWEGVKPPLLLDADALNMLADAGGLLAWPRRSAPVVLTPHPGEMARLAGLTTADVQRDRIGLARQFAVQYGVTLVLKGARTVTATPSGSVFVNTTGNPGMATGGAGDVLAGMIASLIAQGFDAEQAAVFGVYLHGAAGDRAAAKRSFGASLIAGDIIDEL